MMEAHQNTSSLRKPVLVLAAFALLAAVLRYFMKGWVSPLVAPTALGSLLASVTVVLLVGLVVLFWREGKRRGRYFKAAGWFAALAVWCEILVIAGILITERRGDDTYFSGPWEVVHSRFPTGAAHAIGHTQGFVVRLALALLLGGLIFWLAKRQATKSIPAL